MLFVLVEEEIECEAAKENETVKAKGKRIKQVEWNGT